MKYDEIRFLVHQRARSKTAREAAFGISLLTLLYLSLVLELQWAS